MSFRDDLPHRFKQFLLHLFDFLNKIEFFIPFILTGDNNW